MISAEELNQNFGRLFPESPQPRLFFSPGRVNLMGDHIDYCGGKVLPVAIQLGTYFAAALNGTEQVHIYSVHFDQRQSFSLTNIRYQKEDGWTNYPKGVFFEYQKSGLPLVGMNIFCASDLPIGSALSSSASILVGIAFVIQALTHYRHHQDDRLNRKETAKLCHRAEVDFNGLQCGIMDQAAVALGKKGKAMYLNCANLNCEYIDLCLKEHSLLIIDSNKPRQLTDSKYNERKAQAEAALSLIQRNLPVKSLCAIDKNHRLQALSFLKENDILFKRADHIISENLRVEQTRAALLSQDMTALGRLLNESHQSLDRNYEVTGKELDTLVYNSMKFPPVLGARMTGAGFSGCTLTLIGNDSIPAYSDFILPIYKEECGLDARIIPMESCDAAGEIANGR